MKSNEIENILIFLPLCAGMIVSFYFAKRRATMAKNIFGTLGNSYLVGNVGCVISCAVIFLILNLLFDTKQDPFLKLMNLGLVSIPIASIFLGLILYIPSAFLGFNLGARKRAEAEIARTQQQILKDIQSEESVEKD